ncbi:PAS domain-containing protein [Deinococcus malanensis]|uniref:PAS domain-containing protein n=2 Tax=Deinococcus malanensis TaxID=1706855 RepID=UPI003645E623
MSHSHQSPTPAALHNEKGSATPTPHNHEWPYRLLLENSTNLILLYTAQGQLTYVSPASLQVLGYTPDEFFLQPGPSLVHPDDLPSFQAAVAELLNTRVDSVRLEYRARHRHGHYVWLESISRAHRDPATGDVISFHSSTRDITARRHAEEELRRNEAFLRRVMDSSADCIKILDGDGCILFMNEGGQRLMDVTDFTLLLGRNWVDAWDEEQQSTVRNALDEARRSQSSSFQGRLPTLTGQEKWWDVMVTAIAAEDSQPERLLVISRDVTEARRSQQQLSEQASEKVAILESITDAFFALDSQWNFTYLNAQAERLLECRSHDLLGQNLWLMFPEAVGSTFDLKYREAAREGHPVTFEEYYAPLSTWFQVRAYPSAQGLTVYFHDINTRKVAELEQRSHNRVLEMTVQGHPVSGVLREITFMVEQQAPGHFCAIMLAQDEHLTLAAAPSAPIAFHQAFDTWKVQEGAGACSTAAATKQTISVENITSDPLMVELRSFLVPVGVRALTATPILDGDGQVLGVLALYAQHPGPFTKASLETMEKARHLAAIAIEHRRLTDRLHHQAQYDPLTKLPNRSLFTSRLSANLAMAETEGLPWRCCSSTWTTSRE